MSCPVIESIDDAVERRVVSLWTESCDRFVLFGNGAEQEAVVAVLVDLGFSGLDGRFARFLGASVEIVDLVPWMRWRIARAELEAIFAEASVPAGCRNVARASPRHALLILARLYVSAGGHLDAGQREWIETALEQDPHAWARARERSPHWKAQGALDALEAAYRESGDGATSRAARKRLSAALSYLRPAVVALSGLDGSGKSTQARLLESTLASLGIPSLIEHRGLGTNPTIERARGTVRKTVRVMRRVRPLAAVGNSAVVAPLMVTPGSPMPEAKAARAVLALWTTFVSVVSASSQRWFALRNGVRGVVICDRFTLDSTVRLRYLYGESKSFRFQKWLVRTLSPTPLCAFLLVIRPETSLARKRDVWSLRDLERHERLYEEEAPALGVRVLDAERPSDELAAEIARDVWTAWMSRARPHRRSS